MRSWLVLSAVVVVIDQLSKLAASRWLVMYEPQAVLPQFNLTLVHNEGASFGLLSHAGGWQRWLFVVIAVAVCWYLYLWLGRLQRGEIVSAAGIALIIGGAAGNLIDRLFRGHVVDFIDLYYGAYHWPVFNFADSAITIGAVGLILFAVLSPNIAPRKK